MSRLLRVSRYNVFVPAGTTGEHILHNTMSGVILLVDEELRNALEDTRSDLISSLGIEVIAQLKKNGVLLDDSEDELLKYGFRNSVERFSTSESKYIVFASGVCHSTCSSCTNAPGIREGSLNLMDRLTVERTARFIEQTTKSNGSRNVVICFYGMDPLLNLEGCARLASATAKWAEDLGIGFHAILQSNGAATTQEDASSLISDNALNSFIVPLISSVQVTFDSSPSFHDMRNRKNCMGTFGQVLKNTCNLTSHGVHVSARVHFDDESIESLQSFFDALEQCGLKNETRFHLAFNHVEPPFPCYHYLDDAFLLDIGVKGLKIIPKLHDIIREMGWDKHLPASSGLFTPQYSACNFTNRGCYTINTKGGISLCPVAAASERYVIGTITKDGNATWQPEYYELMTRNPLNAPECRSCNCLPACGGGCPMKARINSETYTSSYCGPTKDLIEEKSRVCIAQRGHRSCNEGGACCK